MKMGPIKIRQFRDGMGGCRFSAGPELGWPVFSASSLWHWEWPSRESDRRSGDGRPGVETIGIHPLWEVRSGRRRKPSASPLDGHSVKVASFRPHIAGTQLVLCDATG